MKQTFSNLKKFSYFLFFLLSCHPFPSGNAWEGPSACSPEAGSPSSYLEDTHESTLEVVNKVLQEELEKEPSISSNFFAYKKLNFGVLVSNSKYKIYRSQGLGKKGSKKLKKFLEEHGLEFPKTVIYMNKYGYKPSTWPLFLHPKTSKYHSFSLQQAKLYEKSDDFKDVDYYHPLANDEGKSKVYLHGLNPLKQDELVDLTKHLNEKSRKLFSAAIERPSSKLMTGGKENLYNILEIILQKNQPVLFHCKGGRHRTGMIALGVRYLQGEKWTQPFPHPLKVEATVGYWNKIVVEVRNLAEFEYFTHNKENFRTENLEAMRELAQEDRFIKLKEKYQKDLNE